MKLKKLASIMALGLGLGVMAAPAYSGAHYFFEDDDVEWLLRFNDTTQQYDFVTSGTLDEGDVLVSAFKLPTFEIDGVNAIPADQELTGISAIQVASKDDANNFVFQPWADFGVGYGGAMVAMYLNDLTPTVDLVGANPGQLSCTTWAGCRAQATEGTLFQVDGFTGDLDEFWTALATTDDIGTIKGGAATTPYVFFDAGLSNQFNAWGPVGYINRADGSECANSTGCVQALFSGSIYGGAGFDGTDIIARSDFQAQKYVVPEPTTLVLLGAGLLGLGYRRRRA